MADAKKRALWSTDEMLKAVESASALHERYLIKKHCRKTAEFWGEVGGLVSHSGEQTERLFKNLASDYQRLKQLFHVSGAATDTPTLRGSEALFLMFETFYSLFYPHGGSTLPSVIMTERSTTYSMVHSSPGSSDAAPIAAVSHSNLPSDSASVLSSSANLQVLPTTTTPSTSTTPLGVTSSSAPTALAHISLKRRRAPAPKVGKRKQYDMADMVRLQMRQLQVERERLAVERQKITCLHGIKDELTMMRVALGNASGVEFMHIADQEE